MSKPKPKPTKTSAPKINLTPAERTQFDAIIQAAMTSASLTGNPREGSLVKLGNAVISQAKASSASPNVKRALQERGNWMIAEGPRQQAARIGTEIEKRLKTLPKSKGDHTSLGNRVAAELQNLLQSQGGAKLPPEVRKAIEENIIPYYNRKGNEEHPGTREFEFLFEAPFASSTAQFGFPSEVLSSPNAFYPTQPLIEREYKNQWLFEVLPSGADYEVMVRHQTYRFTGPNEQKQKELIALLAQKPGNDYEKMVIARFQFGEGGKIATRMPDGTAFDGKIPVEITLSKDWWTNSRKREQIKTSLKHKGKVMLVVPFYDDTTTKNSKDKLEQLGKEVWAELPAKTKKEFKNKLDIRLVLT